MTFRSLIEQWPTIADFARDIKVAYGTAIKMHDRDSISDAHWDAIVRAAKARGIRVTIDDLAKWKGVKRQRQRTRRPKRGEQHRPAAA